MQDSKIDGSQSDINRVRLNVGAVDATGRQRRDPNTRREFKKVLEKESEDSSLGDADEKLNAGKMRKGSIFDMQAGMTAVVEGKEDRSSSGKPSKSGKNQKASDYTESRGDLSYLDPNRSANMPIQSRSFDIGSGGSEEAASGSLTLQQIIDQVVDSIHVLKADGHTETVVMLKHPPELVGAELVLTAFSQARGEFNIAIHNLTQAAQLFLEQNNIRLGLKQALEEKGYTVHIITTTTQPFTTVAAEGPESARKDRQTKDEDEGQQQQQRNQ